LAQRRTRKMVNLAIEETSGVDHPAHLHEGWLVMKAADPDAVDKAMNIPMKPEDGADSADASYNDAQEGDMDKSTEEQLEEALAALAKAEAKIAEMSKAVSPEPVIEPSEEDMLKEAPEAVRKAFEAMQKQADDAVAKAAAAEEALVMERNGRADAEAVEKAAKAFSHLGLDPELVGPALRRLADADESLAKAVETALTAADAKVDSADIFTEIGRTAPNTGSAFHKAESMAKAAVTDGKASTVEQAMTDVFLSDPALYTEYLAEKKG